MADIIERYLGVRLRHTTGTWSMNASPTTSSASGPYGDRYAGRDDYMAFIADLMPKFTGYAMDLHRVTYVELSALRVRRAQRDRGVRRDSRWSPRRCSFSTFDGDLPHRSCRRSSSRRRPAMKTSPDVGRLDVMFAFLPGIPGRRRPARHWPARSTPPGTTVCPTAACSNWICRRRHPRPAGFDPLAIIGGGGRPLVLREAVAAIHRAAEDAAWPG